MKTYIHIMLSGGSSKRYEVAFPLITSTTFQQNIKWAEQNIRYRPPTPMTSIKCLLQHPDNTIEMTTFEQWPAEIQVKLIFFFKLVFAAFALF